MAGLSIYLRLIDYNSNVFNSNGTHAKEIYQLKDNAIDPNNVQFIKVINYGSEVEQTLNIGSQSTGAGAGKVTFNPLHITKTLDGVSTTLYQNAASGTPFKTVEIFFVDEKNLVQVLQTYKLVAVKSVAWSAATGDASILETVNFEYGGFILTVNQKDPLTQKIGVLQSGWNRIRNTMDVDLNNVIV